MFYFQSLTSPSPSYTSLHNSLASQPFCRRTSRNHAHQAQVFKLFCDHYQCHFILPSISTVSMYITHLTRHFHSSSSVRNYVSGIRVQKLYFSLKYTKITLMHMCTLLIYMEKKRLKIQIKVDGMVIWPKWCNSWALNDVIIIPTDNPVKYIDITASVPWHVSIALYLWNSLLNSWDNMFHIRFSY